MNLRLLLLNECNRSCRKCCNKNFDLNTLPECTSYVGYESIVLTGGEPMLRQDLIKQITRDVRDQNPTAKIYVQTAWAKGPQDLVEVLEVVDGITLTLHTRKDTQPLETLSWLLPSNPEKSLRVNVFRGISTGKADLTNWQVKKDLRWLDDCPLPANEVFMRIEEKRYGTTA